MHKLLHKKIYYACFWPRLCWITVTFVYVRCCHHFICACLWNKMPKNKRYLQTILFLILRRRRHRRFEKKICKDKEGSILSQRKWADLKIETTHSPSHFPIKFYFCLIMHTGYFCTSNQMFKREIWDKFNEFTFLKFWNLSKDFERSEKTFERFQNFKK